MGLKIKTVVAKGKDIEALQSKFDNILKEAEAKLLDATIQNIQEQQNCALMDCYAAKAEIDSAIANWKTSFRFFSEVTSTIGQVSTKFAKIAKAFADNHYYQCASHRASKALKSSVEKTAKESDGRKGWILI